MNREYKPGDRLVLVTWADAEYPVTVIAIPGVGCDLIVEWTGLRPGPSVRNTICLHHCKEVRYA